MSSSITAQPVTAHIPKVHVTPFLPLTGRLFISAIFILSGAMKFIGWEQTAAFMPYCLYVLTLQQGQIEEITAFVTPEAFPRFGLPELIAARGSP